MPNYIRALGDDKYFRPRLNYRPPSVLFFVKFSTCVLFFFGGQAVLKGAWVSGWRERSWFFDERGDF